jgi:hypothetical protein
VRSGSAGARSRWGLGGRGCRGRPSGGKNQAQDGAPRHGRHTSRSPRGLGGCHSPCASRQRPYSICRAETAIDTGTPSPSPSSKERCARVLPIQPTLGMLRLCWRCVVDCVEVTKPRSTCVSLDQELYRVIMCVISTLPLTGASPFQLLTTRCLADRLRVGVNHALASRRVARLGMARSRRVSVSTETTLPSTPAPMYATARTARQ